MKTIIITIVSLFTTSSFALPTSSLQRLLCNAAALDFSEYITVEDCMMISDFKETNQDYSLSFHVCGDVKKQITYLLNKESGDIQTTQSQSDHCY